MATSNGSRPIAPEDLFKFKFLQDAKPSPDGKYVAYTVSWVDTPEGKDPEEHCAIWLMTLETGESLQLTAGKTRDWSPEWSPDSQEIAFLSARSEKPQIHIISIRGGEARALTNLEQGVSGGPAWSPDGKTLAFSTGLAKPPIDPGKPYRVTRPMYRFDALGYLDNAVQDLYIIPAEGGEPKLLIHNDSVNSAPRWSPDSQQILYSRNMIPDSIRFFPVLFVTNLDGKSRQLTDDVYTIGSAAWTRDGNRVVFLAGRTDEKVGSKNNLWVIDVNGENCVCRTADFLYQPGGGLQGDMPTMMGMGQLVLDDQNAFVNVQVGGVVPIYRIALDGPESCEPVVTGERECFPIKINADRLLFTATSFNETPDLYSVRLDGSLERQLTCLNADILSKLYLPKVEHLNFSAVDGVPLEAWFLKPSQGEAPYPTVLYIHGGPHGAFGHVFSFDFQMLVGAGYGVLITNQRGSTGYGDEFANRIIGDWGNLDYKDLMSAVDHAVEADLADPDRLGVCGISGGGNLSCWIVGQTNRFKAAVPENPVTNWVSMYGVGDLSAWFAPAELGGKPYEIPEVYVRCSPITYAHRCKTPTLLIQGEMDFRCPAEQSEQFYTVLKANGCVTEMLRLPNSPHAGSIMGKLDVRTAQNDALLDWMNRYVLGIQPNENGEKTAE